MTVAKVTWLQIPQFTTPQQTAIRVTEIEQALALPSGVIPFSFGVWDLATGLTDSQLYRAIAGADVQMPIRPAFRGSIVGMSFQASANKTAGTVVFEGFINGTAGPSVTWDSGTDHGVGLWAPGTYGFNANDPLDVRITTDSLTPNGSLDVEAILYVVQQT